MLKTKQILTACIFLKILFLGCASYNPQPLNEKPFRERAVVQTKNGVRVLAAVLGAEETQSIFGLSLYKKGIQPIWLEIENHTQQRIRYAPITIDRDYFSPLEVAYMHHSRFSKSAKQNMDRFFYQHAMRNPIQPEAVRSGFVFTNLEMGTKAFNMLTVSLGIVGLWTV